VQASSFVIGLLLAELAACWRFGGVAAGIHPAGHWQCGVVADVCHAMLGLVSRIADGPGIKLGRRAGVNFAAQWIFFHFNLEC